MPPFILEETYHAVIKFREQGRYTEAINALQLILSNRSSEATAYAHLAHWESRGQPA